MYAAFLDELQKVAASKGRMRVAQSRSGRRPMRVSTMLRKEKEGSLFKDTKVAAVVTPSADDAASFMTKNPQFQDSPLFGRYHHSRVMTNRGRARFEARRAAKNQAMLSAMKKQSQIQAGLHNYSLARPTSQMGKPARGKRKPGDVPSMDEPSSYPKTEQSQTNSSTTALVSTAGPSGESNR